MVLMSSTTATAIASGVLLSVFWLKEKFYPWLDIPALTLVVAGSLGIVFLADKTDEVYTFDDLVELCKSPKAISYLSCIGVFFVLSIISFYALMVNLE